jgi:hypothetical protein
MDFIKDRNPRILTHLKTQFGEFPSYVKSASRSEHQSDTEALDSQLFASRTRKEFPLATPEQTFLSYGYYKVAGVNDPLVERRIKKAAAAHDITEDLLKIDSIVDGQVKSAAVQDTAQNFALSIDRGADGIQHYYPTVSYDHVTKSARDVANDFGKLPIEAFRVAAFNIVKAASEHGIAISQLPPLIRQNGQDRDMDVESALQACGERERRFGKEAAAIYTDIVKSAAIDPENMDDYVNCFVDMDRVNGVKYDGNIMTPYQAFNSGFQNSELEKAANDHVLLADTLVPVDAFKKMADQIQHFNTEEGDIISAIVKTASEDGGISASSDLGKLSPELQKRIISAVLRS